MSWGAMRYKAEPPKRLLKKKRRKERTSKHHLLNKCRGGDCSPENLLQLWREKHDAWHTLFKNSDPRYIIKCLERMMKLKGYEDAP